MVIGRDFAWGHLPKTGGDATLALFRLFPHLIVHADDYTASDKHTYFRDRENEVFGKVLVLNIRSLPSWILSEAQHRAKCGLFPDYKPLPMLSADQMAERRHADNLLQAFTDNGRFQIDRWLRMEYLTQDFAKLITDFTELPREMKLRIVAIGRINGMNYDHDVFRWFTADQIHRMYEMNPLWASVEKEVYGDTLVGRCRDG
jgi:hypothetical protein